MYNDRFYINKKTGKKIYHPTCACCGTAHHRSQPCDFSGMDPNHVEEDVKREHMIWDPRMLRCPSCGFMHEPDIACADTKNLDVGDEGAMISIGSSMLQDEYGS